MVSRPELKVDDDVGFIKFFRSLTQATDTVRLFARGDYYTAHGTDATYIAQTVYRTTSVLRLLGRDPGLESVSLSITVFRNFLRDALFRLGKRVEIWEASGRNGWKVGKKASPGNLQEIEDELGGNLDAAPIILAVKLSAKASDARSVGVCFADASVRELGVCEFLDNDLYSNFESLLIQLGVKECLVPLDPSGKDIELARVRVVADGCGCAVSQRAASDFGTRDVEVDLTRLLRDERGASKLPQTELKLAMGSAAALIKYLGVLSDPRNYGQFQLYGHDLSQYMKLDASALRALNLMPGPRDGSKTMSLFGLLNHCKTPVGSRLLRQWLKQPLMQVAEIEKRHQLVEAFVSDTELRQTVQEEHMRAIPDLYRLAKKFQRKNANLEDVVRTYQVSIRLPAFLHTLDGVTDEQYKDVLKDQYTSPLGRCSDEFSKLKELVETTVDLEALDNHEFIIKPDFDEGLQEIRRRLDELKYDIDVEYRRVGKDLKQDVDKKLFLENHRVNGWCLRLTRAEQGAIRNKAGYQEITTQKNGVYFTTSALAALRREFDQLSERYNGTQTGLVREVVEVASSYCPVIERLAGVLAHLDVIVSFAHASVHAPTAYVRPTMHARGTGATVLKEARHPCLEMQDDVSFITNDVELVRRSSEFLIITGPNMGGKSTYIRQIGVIALMAQIGCFVPCASAELTVFDAILARVGAGDAQLKGVSTFMAEMLEMANILQCATRDSLIIVDELGRGTSTLDGFGLAWAISEQIVAEIGAFALFATHFHELTDLAKKYPQVRNLHVTAHISEAAAAQRPSKRTREDELTDLANTYPREATTAAAESQRPSKKRREDELPDLATAESQRPSKRRREVTLLYKVEPGACDQSFGIHVAELVGFPEKVVRMAKWRADELEDFSGKHESLAVEASSEEVNEASRMMKEVLVRWNADVEGKVLSTGMRKKRLREVVEEKTELHENRYFKRFKML